MGEAAAIGEVRPGQARRGEARRGEVRRDAPLGAHPKRYARGTIAYALGDPSREPVLSELYFHRI
jgi:hypothetical protein